MLHIRDSRGRIVSSSRNLRGIREAVGREIVKEVRLKKRGHGGILVIIFLNGNSFVTEFASFEVLKDMVSRWRNLYGARLAVNLQWVGKVEPDNPALFPERAPRREGTLFNRR